MSKERRQRELEKEIKREKVRNRDKITFLFLQFWAAILFLPLRLISRHVFICSSVRLLDTSKLEQEINVIEIELNLRLDPDPHYSNGNKTVTVQCKHTV